MVKRKVYLNEYQVMMGNAVYLPYSTGLLQAYAQKFPEINEEYEFMPIIFKRDSVRNIVRQYDNPAVAAFSVSMWNYNLSCEVAKRVKKKWPECVIVFGGPHVTEQLPFMDYVIKGEGEKTFMVILDSQIGIARIDYDIMNRDIDQFPSPYTSGVFDHMLKSKPGLEFQAIIETTRGCPYSCAFCFWGHQGSRYKQFRFHSLDYIMADIEWLGKNKIEYVFVSDSNFGMVNRDVEVAEIFKDINEWYGYPEKVRVCYGKSSRESIVNCAKVLHDAGLSKAVTLSRQSNNHKVLKNVNRGNIGKKEFNKLGKIYRDYGISTYSEMILGLPEETSTSFKTGILEVIKASPQSRLFIYHCSILPNTRMADPEYQKTHGIKTVKIPLCEVHGKVRSKNIPIEYDEIVVQTNSISMAEWIELAVWSWEKQLVHGLGYKGDIPIHIHVYFYLLAVGITEGRPRCQHVKRFGNIYWEPEEVAFLMLNEPYVKNIKKFAKQTIIYGRKGDGDETSPGDMPKQGTAQTV